MNQLRGILLGLVLISGAVFVPAQSFAQPSNHFGPYSSFFELMKYLFSENATVVTHSGSILDFNRATVVLTSSTTTTDSGDNDSGDNDSGDNDSGDNDSGDNDSGDNDSGDNDSETNFQHGRVTTSSATSVDSNEKETICHVSPGNGNTHTISVGKSAVPAHLAHGDSLGACDSQEIHNDVKESKKQNDEQSTKKNNKQNNKHNDD